MTRMWLLRYAVWERAGELGFRSYASQREVAYYSCLNKVCPHFIDISGSSSCIFYLKNKMYCKLVSVQSASLSRHYTLSCLLDVWKQYNRGNLCASIA
jgi:hypothetical protein